MSDLISKLQSKGLNLKEDSSLYDLCLSDKEVVCSFLMINGNKKTISYNNKLQKKMKSKSGEAVAPILSKKIIPNSIVFITEGETDAISLEKYTNQIMVLPGARSCKSIAENSEVLKQKLGSPSELHVLFDNDDPGKEGARVTASVLKNVFRDSKVVIFKWGDSAFNDVRELINSNAASFNLENLMTGKEYSALSIFNDENSKNENLLKIKPPLDFDRSGQRLFLTVNHQNKLHLLECHGKEVRSVEEWDLKKNAAAGGGPHIKWELIDPSMQSVVDSISLSKLEAFLKNQDDNCLISDLIEFIKRHVYLEQKSDYTLIASYILMSYCYPCFETVPYLCLKGSRGTGKTTLSSLITDIAFNGCIQSDSSKAAIRRGLHKKRGLYCFDDAELFSITTIDNQDFISLLNSSNKPRFVSMICDGSSNTEKEYYTGGPKVFNAIQLPQRELLSRMICVQTTYAPESAEVARLRMTEDDICNWKTKLLAWAISNFESVFEFYCAIDNQLASSRDSEMLSPLLAIASTFKGEEKLKKHLRESMEASQKIKGSKVDMYTCVVASVIIYLRENNESGDFWVKINELADILEELGEECIPSHRQSLKTQIGIILREHPSYIGKMRKSSGDNAKLTVYQLNAECLEKESLKLPDHLLEGCPSFKF